MNELELKEFLDYKAEQYESADFIESDPIQIPHQFNSKADIEISAFFVAMLTWKNNKYQYVNCEEINDQKIKVPLQDSVSNVVKQILIDKQYLF